MKEFQLGRVAGLNLSAAPSALVGSLALLVLFAGIGIGLLNLSAIEAIIGAIIAVFLHGLSEFAHQEGHAWAARRTGYPMIGVRFWAIFGASIYPADEGELPASVHIRRALGGAPASLIFSLAAGVIALAVRSNGGLIWWLAVFLFLDNLLFFGLGAFLPLGFTDGSTLLYWLRR